MRRVATFMLASVGLAAAVGGCAAEPGTSRSLGSVPYDQAFLAGREVMSQYFSVARSDAVAGVIESRPEPAEQAPRLLSGGYPARRKAALRLRRQDGQVVAVLAVPVERLVTAGLGARSDTYSMVPSQTPAEEAAAVTPEQAELWQLDHYDHALERRILNDLYRRLHPQPPSEP